MSVQPSFLTLAVRSILDELASFGVYMVRRGAFNIATHDYESHPRSAHLMVMRTKLVHDPEIQTEGVESVVQLVLAARTSGATDAGDVDDGLLDDMRAHAQTALTRAGGKLVQLSALNGSAYLADININQATVEEFQDLGVQRQGIVVTFPMRT